jgi:hypothetical protein
VGQARQQQRTCAVTRAGEHSANGCCAVVCCVSVQVNLNSVWSGIGLMENNLLGAQHETRLRVEELEDRCAQPQAASTNTTQHSTCQQRRCHLCKGAAVLSSTQYSFCD